MVAINIIKVKHTHFYYIFLKLFQVRISLECVSYALLSKCVYVFGRKCKTKISRINAHRQVVPSTKYSIIFYRISKGKQFSNRYEGGNNKEKIRNYYIFSLHSAGNVHAFDSHNSRHKCTKCVFQSNCTAKQKKKQKKTQKTTHPFQKFPTNQK